MRRSFSRRRLLHATGLATATAASLAASSASAADPNASASLGLVEPPEGQLPFVHGVASGDPIPDSVILWTRVTPTEEALPGSGVGPAVTVEWEVARDEGMRDVVKRGHAQATADHDHTVHVDPHGLEPDTVYFYRFLVDGASSPIGRTKTAPAANASPDKLTFGVASCANWESGFFSAYRDIAQRARGGQLDYMVFLGDYIYEYRSPTPVSGRFACTTQRTRLQRWRITARATDATVPTRTCRKPMQRCPAGPGRYGSVRSACGNPPAL